MCGGGVTHGMELQWVRLDRGFGALQENLSTDLIKQKGGGGIKEREQRGRTALHQRGPSCKLLVTPGLFSPAPGTGLPLQLQVAQSLSPPPSRGPHCLSHCPGQL